jgi:hypothetical protein
MAQIPGTYLTAQLVKGMTSGDLANRVPILLGVELNLEASD